MDVNEEKMGIGQTVGDESEEKMTVGENDTVVISLKDIKGSVVAYTTLDRVDYERVRGAGYALTRHAHPHSNTHVVAISKGAEQSLLTHFLIGDPPFGYVVDHLNGDTMTNTRGNLRHATFSENAQNRRKMNGTTSVYIGVCWAKNQKKWVGHVSLRTKRQFLGYFTVESDAGKAYDKFVLYHYGIHAKTNQLLNDEEVAQARTSPPTLPIRRKKNALLPTGVHPVQGSTTYQARWQDAKGERQVENCKTIKEAVAYRKARLDEIQATWKQGIAALPITRNAEGVAFISTNTKSGTPQRVLVSDAHWHNLQEFSWNWKDTKVRWPIARVDGKTVSLRHHVWKLAHPSFAPTRREKIKHRVGPADCRIDKLELVTYKK